MKYEQLRIFLKKWIKPTNEQSKDFEKDLNDLLVKEKCPVCSDDDGFPLTEWQREILFKAVRDLDFKLQKIIMEQENMKSQLKFLIMEKGGKE